MFALVVFASDGFLEFRKGQEADAPTTRFFRIAGQLPMELQMVLCYRVVGRTHEGIRSWDCEAAFRDLTKFWEQKPKRIGKISSTWANTSPVKKRFWLF